jgi:hypothetical protein
MPGVHFCLHSDAVGPAPLITGVSDKFKRNEPKK